MIRKHSLLLLALGLLATAAACGDDTPEPSEPGVVAPEETAVDTADLVGTWHSSDVRPFVLVIDRDLNGVAVNPSGSETAVRITVDDPGLISVYRDKGDGDWSEQNSTFYLGEGVFSYSGVLVRDDAGDGAVGTWVGSDSTTGPYGTSLVRATTDTRLTLKADGTGMMSTSKSFFFFENGEPHLAQDPRVETADLTWTQEGDNVRIDVDGSVSGRLLVGDSLLQDRYRYERVLE